MAVFTLRDRIDINRAIFGQPAPTLVYHPTAIIPQAVKSLVSKVNHAWSTMYLLDIARL